MKKEFKTFKEFYPFYLSEHQNPTCRRLHFLGTLSVLVLLAVFSLTRHVWVLPLMPVLGYGFAWIGHFFFEKNHPATFRYPLFSFFGDWVMFTEILTGKLKSHSNHETR